MTYVCTGDGSHVAITYTGRLCPVCVARRTLKEIRRHG